MPRERPRDKFGTSQGHPGRLGRFMWKFTFKGQNVRGTDGTDDGTDGTCPRDRWETNQGVSSQNSLCLLFFFFSPCSFMSSRPLALSETFFAGISWEFGKDIPEPSDVRKKACARYLAPTEEGANIYPATKKYEQKRTKHRESSEIFAILVPLPHPSLSLP